MTVTSVLKPYSAADGPEQMSPLSSRQGPQLFRKQNVCVGTVHPSSPDRAESFLDHGMRESLRPGISLGVPGGRSYKWRAAFLLGLGLPLKSPPKGAPILCAKAELPEGPCEPPGLLRSSRQGAGRPHSRPEPTAPAVRAASPPWVPAPWTGGVAPLLQPRCWLVEERATASRSKPIPELCLRGSLMAHSSGSLLSGQQTSGLATGGWGAQGGPHVLPAGWAGLQARYQTDL